MGKSLGARFFMAHCVYTNCVNQLVTSVQLSVPTANVRRRGRIGTHFTIIPRSLRVSLTIIIRISNKPGVAISLGY